MGRISLWFRIITFPQQWFRSRRRTVVHILFHSPCTSYFRFHLRPRGRPRLPSIFSPRFLLSLLSVSTAVSADGYLAHPEPPWAGSRSYPYPGTFLVLGDSRFVLLCTLRATGPLCPVGFIFFRKNRQLNLGTSRLGLCLFGIFQSVHHAYAPVRDRTAHDLSYQHPLRSNQLWQVFLRVSYLVLEHTALGLGDSQDNQLFSSRPFTTVRFLGC